MAVNYNVKLEYDVDSEFQPVTDKPTKPISVQLKGRGLPPAFYLHPNADLTPEQRKHETFDTPLAPIHYYNMEYRYSKVKSKGTCTFVSYLYFSFKDIENQFAFIEDYLRILPELERVRRISSMTSVMLKNNAGENLQVFYNGMWLKVSLKVMDISGIQGIGSLKTHANNVGIHMDTKDCYSALQKKNMTDEYIKDPHKFEEYSNGDLVCDEINQASIVFFNKIAGLIGVRSREEGFGMTTGKIVGSMISEYIANQLGISVKTFSESTHVAGSEGITNLIKLFKRKDLVYLAMVDGGRAVSEKAPDTYRKDPLVQSKGMATGIFVDQDIDGCYGNGLKNTVYCVGNPTQYTDEVTLGKFETDVINKCEPGNWYARISWVDAPFAQDLLISKVESEFRSFDNGVNGGEDDGKKVYDANMVLLTHSVHQAAFTSDFWEVLKNYTSNAELSWIRKNAKITSGLAYLKKNKREKFTKAMTEGCKSPKDNNGVLTCTDYVEVDLRPLLEIMLAERKRHPKKTPMNTLLKLCINTIYGVITSEFFSTEDTGISNVVMANNITARARVLTWCMAKGLGGYMSITDGGAFDLNRVNTFLIKSLATYEALHRGEYNQANREVKIKTSELLGRYISEAEVKSSEWSQLQKTIDIECWNHLAKEFPKLRIFAESQFNFESKRIFTGITMHSKVDYRLNNVIAGDGKGFDFVAIRGLPKEKISTLLPDGTYEIKSVVNKLATTLFDHIERDETARLEYESTSLLSLSDYRKNVLSGLTPHDSVTDVTTLYTHTPLYKRYINMKAYKSLTREYDKAKETRDALAVRALC